MNRSGAGELIRKVSMPILSAEDDVKYINESQMPYKLISLNHDPEQE
jgi:hypothetical protein